MHLLSNAAIVLSVLEGKETWREIGFQDRKPVQSGSTQQFLDPSQRMVGIDAICLFFL